MSIQRKKESYMLQKVICQHGQKGKSISSNVISYFSRTISFERKSIKNGKSKKKVLAFKTISQIVEKNRKSPLSIEDIQRRWFFTSRIFEIKKELPPFRFCLMYIHTYLHSYM
jgi:hypothetical protein